MTSAEIISHLRRQGVAVTEKRVIAARRSGELAYRRDGRFLRSEQAEVCDWAERGCPAGDSTPKAAAARPEAKAGPLDTHLLLSCCVDQLTPAQIVDLVHTARLEVMRMAADLDAAQRRVSSAELSRAQLEGELLEQESRLQRSERELARLVSRHANVRDWAALEMARKRLSGVTIGVYLVHALEPGLPLAEIARRLGAHTWTVRRAERELVDAELATRTTDPTSRTFLLVDRRGAK